MSDRWCDRCDSELSSGGVCQTCERKAKFGEFAKGCGLVAFPSPDGERYLHDLDGSCRCKKGEEVEFMDQLWNALCRAKGRDELQID